MQALLADRHKLALLVGAVAAVVVVVVAAVVAATAPVTLNMRDYVTVGCYGYDGYGEAYASIDSQALYNAVWEACRDKGGTWNDDVYFNDCENLSYPLLDKSSDLSNGDVLTVSLPMDPNTFENLHVSLNTDSFTYEVQDLEPVTQVDPFDYLDVSFEGISGEGTLEVDFLDGYYAELSYSADRQEGLSNGDTVTVYVSYDDSSDFSGFTAQYGLMPSPTSKDYEVSGLTERLVSIDTATQDYASVEKDARDALDEYFGNYSPTVTDTTLLGEYVLRLKDGVEETDDLHAGYLFFVYRVTLQDSAGGTHVVYTYAGGYDPLVDGQGKVSVEYEWSWWSANPYLPGEETSFEIPAYEGADHTRTCTIRGYDSLDALRQKLENMENYDVADQNVSE